MPIITVFSPDHVLHDPPHEFLEGKQAVPHESPMRAELIRAAVEQAALGPIVPPRTFGLEPIRAVHDAGYLAFLEHGYEHWVAAGGAPSAMIPDAFAVRWMAHPPHDPLNAPGYYIFDTSAPITSETYRAARASAEAALTGAVLLQEGHRAVYALCRPPGHHAGSDMGGGYCFLNNAAIAAQYLLGAGNDRHVAILDIDYHHGNGTQQIFYERADVFVASIHADPLYEYPYFSGSADERGSNAGAGYNLNVPLPAGTTNQQFLAALDRTLDALAATHPHFLVLSAGFDTFGGDPLGKFTLSAEAYTEIGQRIAALALPTVIVQEGGYATTALGENVVHLLRAFAAKE